MRILLLLVLASSTLASCAMSGETTSAPSSSGAPAMDSGTPATASGTSGTGSADATPPTISIGGTLGMDGIYHPVFGAGEKAGVHITHVAGKPTTIEFPNAGAKSMDVAIAFSTGTGGNLRVSQIIAPDGSADGPFGLDTQYNLKQTGTYKVIISEDMMAGDPWSGAADVTITLNQKSYPDDVKIVK